MLRRIMVAACVAALGAGAVAAANVPENSKALTEMVTAMSHMGKCNFPSFSPDDQTVCFVCDMSGSPQLWMVPAKGGWPNQITALEDPVIGEVWSGKSDWLAFLAGGGARVLQLVRADGTGLKSTGLKGVPADWTGDGKKVIVSVNQEGKKSTGCLLDPLTGALEQVSGEDEVLYDVTADGRFALTTRWLNNFESNVYLLDRKNKTEKLITPHSGQAHNDGGGCNRSRPRFSADGRRVYLVSNNDRKLAGFAQIKISANGEAGPLEYLSVRDDAEVVGFAINDAGSATALAWSRSKKNKITIVDLVSGKTSLLPDPPDGSVTEIGISHKGKNIVASILDSLKPWDVWILNDGASSWQQLTHSQHPGLNLDKLIPWELLTFKSADGKVRGGKILRPQSHAPAPYVIALGGGGGSNSSAEHQALVAAGIGVFIPIEAEDIEVVADNYDWHDDSGNWFRSYGNESWQFDKNGLMKHDEGEEAARQLKRLKDCVDYLGSSGIADPKRIGITGSGYETLNAVTEFPDTFAACVERSGWVDFSTFLKNTTPGSAKFFNAEYGSPQSNPKLMDLLSPIKRLDRVKAFVMVQHGALDDTVPVEEAQQVIDYFKKHGKPAESLIVPDEGHTFHKLSNQVKSTVALVLFFVNHLHPDVATN